MNINQYNEMRAAVEDTFTSLYVIDVGSLTSAQRKKHQNEMAVAYLAVIRLENKIFEELTNEAIKLLEPLHEKTKLLQQQLAGLKKAAETLKIVDASLNVLITIVEILT